MDDEELLQILKTEMLLTEARAKGAREAYKRQLLYVARSKCKIRPTDRILIKFSDGDQLAVFDWIYPSEIDNEKPMLYGWKILKNGKRSKIRQMLCAASMLPYIKKIN